MSTRSGIAVTGVGLGTPAGYLLEENLAAIEQGKGSFAELSHFEHLNSVVRYGGACPPPDAKKLPDRKVQKILRRKDVIGLLVSLETARHAGIEKGRVNPDRFGMYVGASATQVGDLESYYDLVRECTDVEAGTFRHALFGEQLMSKVNPLVVLQGLMNNGLCFSTMTLDIRGVNANFLDFQISGIRAVGEAFRSITTGRADIVLAGGVAGPVEPYQLNEGVEFGHIAKTRDSRRSPSDIVRPWDRDREGSILSEGSAYLMLESAEHAAARQAQVLGRITGFGMASDGAVDISEVRPSPGLVRAMQSACQEAGISPGELGMIAGYGSGSCYLDGVEAASYTAFLGDSADRVPVYSVKGVLGDLSEAAGPLAMVVSLYAIRSGRVPPTRNFSSGDKHSSKLRISSAAQECRRPSAIITARNFLGSSVAMVVTGA